MLVYYNLDPQAATVRHRASKKLHASYGRRRRKFYCWGGTQL